MPSSRRLQGLVTAARLQPVKQVSSSRSAWLRVLVFALGVALAVGASHGAGTAVLPKKVPPAEWVTLNACKFMTEELSDGDSFHVKYGQREFIFRLYFVDAPETDEKLKERIREQCEYFGVTRAEVLKAGKAAKKFTAERLKKDFTVTTRWQNALGRSRLSRYYAQIDVSGKDLAEMLVSSGLARVKGAVAILPEGGRAKDHKEMLQRLEDEAKAKRIGLWAHSKSADP